MGKRYPAKSVSALRKDTEDVYTITKVPNKYDDECVFMRRLVSLFVSHNQQQIRKKEKAFV